MTGIVGAGAYAPRLRVTAAEFEEAWGTFEAAGIERKAVPDADEDSLTMAYEAARRALSAANATGRDVSHLAFATTTPPLEEEELPVRLASTLGAPSSVDARTFSGSTRAGALALESALETGASDGVSLVVAADCPRGAPDSPAEHAAGAGAAALVLADDGAATVPGRGTYAEPYPGTRFRPRGSDEVRGLGVTQYDRDAFTTALGGAVDDLQNGSSGDGGDADEAPAVADVDAAAVQSPDAAFPYRAASALGVDAERIRAASTVESLGDTGAAGPLLGLVEAFADGAETTLVAAFGSGAGASALLVEGRAPVERALEGTHELRYAEYLRRRGDVTSGEPEGGGAYVSVPTWKRSLPQRHRLEAGRCGDCGALAFPPAGACTDCGELTAYEPVVLPGTGTVEAITTVARGGAPPEFVEQQRRSGEFASAVVAFDGPDGESSVSAPAQVVTADGDERPDVGDPVVATIRRIYRQEGVPRYGFKVRPRSVRR